MAKKNLRDIYLLIITGVLFYLLFNLIASFASTLLFALLAVAIFQPVHKAIAKRSNKFVATFISTLLVILIVVVPLVLAIGIISGEVGTISAKASAFVNRELLTQDGGLKFIDSVSNFIRNFNPNFTLDINTLQSSILSLITTGGNFLSNLLVSLFQNIGSIFVQLIVFLFSLVLLFQDYDKIPLALQRYSPLSDDLDQILFKKFIDTGKSIVRGIFLVSLVHAVTLTIIFYFFGIEGLGVFFLLLFICSLIPGGSQLIWIPVALFLGFTVGWPVAIALAILCLIAMNIIDALIRPVLTGGGAAIHPLLSLICVLGGLVVYGLPGLLYGPLIGVMFITIMAVYNQRFKEDEKI